MSRKSIDRMELWWCPANLYRLLVPAYLAHGIYSRLPPSPPSSPPLTMCGRRTSRFERVTACVGLMVGRSLSEQRVGMMRRDNVVVVAVHVQRRDGTASQCRQWRDLRVHGARKTKSKWQCHKASVGQSLIRAAVAGVARRVP